MGKDAVEDQSRSHEFASFITLTVCITASLGVTGDE